MENEICNFAPENRKAIEEKIKTLTLAKKLAWVKKGNRVLETVHPEWSLARIRIEQEVVREAQTMYLIRLYESEALVAQFYCDNFLWRMIDARIELEKDQEEQRLVGRVNSLLDSIDKNPS